MLGQQRRTNRSTVLFVFLLVVSFLITTVDVRAAGEGFGASLRDGAQAVFSPIQRLAAALTDPVVGFIDGVANLASLRSENETLRSRVIELENQLAANEATEARLSELERILALETPADIDTVTAEVLATGPSIFDHTITLNKGSDHGIAEGMAVVDELGLVGRVIAVSDDAARVRLITDPLLCAAIRVQETQETGWVCGEGDGPLSLQMHRASETVREGYRVVTGGGRFPPGLAIGTVVDPARSEAGFTLRTTVQLFVDMGRLDFVKVLISTAGDEPIVDEPAGGLPVESDPEGAVVPESPAAEEGAGAPEVDPDQ